MSAYKKQIGGNHYSRFKVQPSKFINDNNLQFAEGNAIKYICRHAYKGGKQDLEKAKHYIDMIIERDYPTKPIKEKDEKPPETSPADWIKGYKEWKKNK